MKDPEVNALATRLAALRQETKTEVVRRALERELERETVKPSLIEEGVAFVRRLRAQGDAAGGRPADKAFIDSLYENP